MKKKTFFIVLIITILGLYLGYGMYNYYAPPQKRAPYRITKKHDDTLNIAYIGDSWAYMHQEHQCMIPYILSDTLHRPVKVYTFGVGGRTSKELYEIISNNSDFKDFIQKRNFKYCFIVLGINDTYKKMSTAYYQHSMEYIIDFFLVNHIHPIILEIPDYEIKKSFNRQKKNRILLRHLSMIVNNTPIDCKQQFREAFDKMVIKKNYSDKISIIRYKSWNSDGEKDLKTLYLYDGMHPNERGYVKLDSCIIDVCVKLYNVEKKHNLAK